MRKSDKLKNFKKANLLAENRYFESKGFESESFDEIDETQMGVDSNHMQIQENDEMDLETNPKLLDNIMTGILNVVNPYINRQIGAGLANNNWEVLLKKIPILFNQELTRNRKYKDEFGKEYSKLNNVQGGKLDEEYLSEGEDNLGLYKAEMKKTGDYGWTYNNGQKERAADEEIRNKKAKEAFKHNFMQKYMEQTINTTDGVYTFDNIHYLSNYGDYLVIFTRPSNDNDNVIRGHEILLWLVYDVTNGYYVKDNKKDIKLTDEDSKNKVKEMLSYNKFIQPEK